ncbi:MAG: helix-turn-helix transcriptional regulator [Lachnospiraceae bacterium]|nr:helix-turn-helix transcriptional regulator [Lachnospiraceae bacterium]
MNYKRIREERERAQLTQQEMADALGINRRTYSSYETGVRGLPVDVLAKLADMFGTSTDYLLGNTDIKNTDKITTPKLPKKKQFWVVAKKKTVLSAAAGDILISEAVQEGSKWLAFYEPEINEVLPWRANHKHLNIRVTEDKFSEIFDSIDRGDSV